MSKCDYSFEMDIKLKVDDYIDEPPLNPHRGGIHMELSSKHKGTGERVYSRNLISKAERENPPIFCKDVGELICYHVQKMLGRFLEAFRRDRQ